MLVLRTVSSHPALPEPMALWSVHGCHTRFSFTLAQQENLQYELITADKCSASVKLQERCRRKWIELKSNLVRELLKLEEFISVNKLLAFDYI